MRQYLLDVARYWIDFGIDGWRLDVPEEIDDADFWRAFRATVKEGNPDAYIVGEIWHEAREWLRGDRFDAVMNYVFSRLALGFFGAETLRTEYKPGGYTLVTLDARDLAAGVHHMYGIYSWEVAQAQMNLMDSHDTARTLWTVGDDESALRLCTLFQMTMPGAPCIYYGDEIGMTGANDPFSRGAFPWHDTTQWNQDLLDFFRRAIALRNQHAVLRTGCLRHHLRRRGRLRLHAHAGQPARDRALQQHARRCRGRRGASRQRCGRWRITGQSGTTAAMPCRAARSPACASRRAMPSCCLNDASSMSLPG